MKKLYKGEIKALKTQKLQGKSERAVLASVTFSHLAQHFYAGFSVLYPEIMMSLNLNYTQLGIITGTTTIISGFLQLIWSLLNRYVSKRILLGIGNIIISMGCLIMGTANKFIEMLGGNVVSGVGQAAQHPVGTSILTHKFSEKKISGALSIHYGLGYVGNIISPILLSLIALSVGWRQATYVLALIPFITGLTVLFSLRGEQSALKSIQDSEKGGLLKDINAVIHKKEVVLIWVAQAFAVGGTGMGVIVTYTPLFLKNILHVGSIETSIIYSIAVLGGVLGTIFFGQLAGKIGNLKMVTTLVGIGSTLIFLLTLHNSFSLLLIPHLFIIGATSFSTGSLLQAHLASISTPRQRDIVIGLFFTFGFGISSMWTALTGFLIDYFNSFVPVWFLRATLGIIAFSFLVWASRQNSTKL